MVKIRFTQTGRAHRRLYRLVAADQKSPRDGRMIEVLGTYDPAAKEFDDKFKINEERVNHWLSVGGQPTPKVWALLRKKGINKATAKTVRQERSKANA
ncbi:MAG: 30S ribosomal protein S16 [Planctomycetes bacterium]|nr:30S ribosomal protein S16 [Planctomycetota bacterium]